MMSSTTRQTEATSAKQAILDAAERLFAERGFAATSMRDLAAAAGTSKALVHHHFGNKDELYQAVISQVIARYAERQQPNLAATADPRTSIIEGMRTLFQFYKENPSMVRLGAWAQLEGTSTRWPGDEQYWNSVVARVCDAQAAGVLRDDIEPVLLIQILGALNYSWWQFKEAKSHLLDEVPDPETLDERYLQAALEVFLQGAAGPAAKQQPQGCPPGERAPGEKAGDG